MEENFEKNFNINETLSNPKIQEKLRDFYVLKEKVFYDYKKEKETSNIFDSKIIKFAQKLQSKYPDYIKYVLYLGLSGGTPDEKCNKYDFPGEDSVFTFFKNLEKEIEKHNKKHIPGQIDIDFESVGQKEEDFQGKNRENIIKEFHIGPGAEKILHLEDFPQGKKWCMYKGQTVEEWDIDCKNYEDENRKDRFH